MQMRELNKQQYTYLKDVLGVETVVSAAVSKPLNYERLTLLSAPLSSEEKDLLSKITQAFGWTSFEIAVAGDLNENIQVKQIFIFGDEAKKYFDANIKSDEAILAPSLGILLRDTEAKKILWQQMKQLMEA